MRLPRFTVRRLMIAVAIASLILALEIGRERRVEFLLISRMHGNEEKFYLERIKNLLMFSRENPDPRIQSRLKGASPLLMKKVETLLDSKRKPLIALAEYHLMLRKKYAQAARTPWILVPPDPPVPE